MQRMLFLIPLVFAIKSSAQFGGPALPQAPSFQPVEMFGQRTPNYQPPAVRYDMPQTHHVGATAQDIINQQNSAAHRQSEGPATYYNRQQEQREELRQLAAEAGRSMPSRSQPAAEDYNSPAFIAKTKTYTDALKRLQAMLAGREKLSLAQAYYQTEAAYGKPYLSHSEFNALLDKSAQFIRAWMRQEGLSPSDNEALHYAIQQFMGRNLVVTTPQRDGPNRIDTHSPFYYDFDDFRGEQDHRSFFLTKCLATGSGQCASLPAAYLCLAERLGAKAYLTFAPQHSLVKYPSKNGVLTNYEPTSHWKITDQWYQDDMLVSAAAYRSGIYLDTLNSKQIVANCVLDLAFGYGRKFDLADGRFFMECLKTAAPYFPRGNNIQLHFLLSNYQKGSLARLAAQNGYKDVLSYARTPQGAQIYKDWLETEEEIKRLGYQDMPEGMYETMLKEHEFKGEAQQEAGVESKFKRQQFHTIK